LRWQLLQTRYRSQGSSRRLHRRNAQEGRIPQRQRGRGDALFPPQQRRTEEALKLEKLRGAIQHDYADYDCVDYSGSVLNCPDHAAEQLNALSP
jgi:hypothetical protein